MAWYIDTTIYELKGSLSRFIRAMSRGDVDYVNIRRYGRLVAFMVPMGNRDKPAKPPEKVEDIIMQKRSYWLDHTGEKHISRRPPPPPKIF